MQHACVASCSRILPVSSTLATTPEPRHDGPLPCRPGRPGRRAGNAAAQRERILDVATRLFAARGYAGTTMHDIVAELGVSKPFVYYYFRDKQQIFETLSWRPAVACFTVLDFDEDDRRRAGEKVVDGLGRLIRTTIAHQPAAFFSYREPQVYRPEYRAAQKRLANHFYDKLCALLEQARADGDLDFRNTKITALAACSLPGFLYNWYRPDGRLSPDELATELTELATRVIGLRPKTRRGAR